MYRFPRPELRMQVPQGAPVFMLYRMALNIRRSSLRFRPLVSVLAFANIGPIMGHFSSVMSCLFIQNSNTVKNLVFSEIVPRE